MHFKIALLSRMIFLSGCNHNPAVPPMIPPAQVISLEIPEIQKAPKEYLTTDYYEKMRLILSNMLKERKN